MTSKKRRKRGQPIGADRHISIRSARRATVDGGKYADAMLSMALAQTEADAQAQDMRTRLSLRTRRSNAQRAQDDRNG
jgi:hypothetical protein